MNGTWLVIVSFVQMAQSAALCAILPYLWEAQRGWAYAAGALALGHVVTVALRIVVGPEPER